MSAHAQRVQAVRDMFTQVNDILASEVESLEHATAVRNPAPDSWNAAQVAHHVALTTEFLSGGLSGSIREVVKPRPADFQETLASMDLSGPVKTFPILEPPADADPGDSGDQAARQPGRLLRRARDCERGPVQCRVH